MQEIWKPVLGFEGFYEVSNRGAVRTVGRKVPCIHGHMRWLPEKKLSHYLGTRGYIQVTLNANGKKKQSYLAHRLVAIAFIPNPGGMPQVNHRDGNKTHNHVSNLEWCTGPENCAHARIEKLYEPARGERAGGAKLTNAQAREIKMRLAQGERHTAIALDYPVSRTVVTRIANGTRWAHIQ